jgi:phage terminase large subunit-like protein
VGWLPVTLYDRTQWHVPELEERLKGNALRRAIRESLRGKICYGGLDLSSTTDLSAFTLIFPPQPGLATWVTLFWAWRPAEGVLEAEKRDHVVYRDWERAGFLHLCDGDMVDFGEIEETIKEAARTYQLKMLGVDPWLSRMMSDRLTNAGLNVIEIRQGMWLSPAMKDLERLLRGREMLHEHNTAARWCFGNVRCLTDTRENIAPSKKHSTGRIDMVVAWIIAYATYMTAPVDPLVERLKNGEFTF